ncbi:major facilitator superfamily MFS_1 [Bradyrhizobiaceae bacterium SG-6C]|nr:major facilitator superfamily MFS_1 [Bradyrhizobiaceae bacterium SG-6C]
MRGLAKTPLQNWQDTIARVRLVKCSGNCHGEGLPPEPFVTPAPSARDAHPVRAVLTLSLAPAIGLGMARFAYALVLPDMRESLGWSYSAAGFLNTVNAIGYLAGALVMAGFIRRVGAFRATWIGAIACTLSLAVCVMSGNFAVLSLARLCAGIASAATFIAGGALAAWVAQSRPAQSALLLGLFYTGPGTGLIVSGLAAPFLLQYFGPGSWWIVWGALALLSAIMTAVLMLNRVEAQASHPTAAAISVPLRPIALYLIGYFMFGAGYIAYMTFMIAYVRDGGGSAIAQSLFWCLIGLGSFAAPWLWRGLLARGASGIATATLLGTTMLGTLIALLGTSPLTLGASAAIFGVSFLSVVASTTAFVRLNYPPAAWPKGIGIMAVTFGLGQTLGPFATGAVTDLFGLSYGLVLSAATLGLGMVLCACQRKVKR